MDWWFSDGLQNYFLLVTFLMRVSGMVVPWSRVMHFDQILSWGDIGLVKFWNKKYNIWFGVLDETSYKIFPLLFFKFPNQKRVNNWTLTKSGVWTCLFTEQSELLQKISKSQELILYFWVIFIRQFISFLNLTILFHVALYWADCIWILKSMAWGW